MLRTARRVLLVLLVLAAVFTGNSLLVARHESTIVSSASSLPRRQEARAIGDRVGAAGSRSTLPHHWADIPVGDVSMRTWVRYPEGTGPAPVVLVMQHGTGMENIR